MVSAASPSFLCLSLTIVRDLHNPLSYVARIGWAGVDLFFVLSGFLITGILYDTRGSHNFFKVFYARRTLRLLPVYFLAVCFVLAVATASHSPRSWLQIPFFIYCANIVIAISGSIATFPPYLVCGHFWSLALEEQFYSLWPLVVFFVPSRRGLIKICIVSFGAALLLRVVLIGLKADLMGIVYMQLPTRMDSLLAGALLALVVRGPKREAWFRPFRLWSVIGVLGVILMARNSWAKSPSMISVPMCSVGYTLLAGICLGVLALGLIPGTFVNRVGKNQILRFFGRYSYGLYLWHFVPSRFVWPGFPCFEQEFIQVFSRI